MPVICQAQRVTATIPDDPAVPFLFRLTLFVHLGDDIKKPVVIPERKFIAQYGIFIPGHKLQAAVIFVKPGHLPANPGSSPAGHEDENTKERYEQGSSIHAGVIHDKDSRNFVIVFTTIPPLSPDGKDAGTHRTLAAVYQPCFSCDGIFWIK